MTMRITQVLCAGALLAPFAANAQQSVGTNWPVASTSRVRILAPKLGEKRQTGTLVSATNDSIVFMPAKGQDYQSLALGDVTHLEVAQGTHTNRWKGTLLGFAILGGVSAATAALTWREDREGQSFIDFGRGGDAAIVGMSMGLVGGVAGAIIGSRHSDTWVPVHIR
jgi:hypothetical protein